MSDTVIDFGGFAVDVSKIQWLDRAGVIPDTFVKIGATGLWIGPDNAKTLREAHEKYLESLRPKHPDGWYLVGGGSVLDAIRYIRNGVSYHPCGMQASHTISVYKTIKPLTQDAKPPGF